LKKQSQLYRSEFRVPRAAFSENEYEKTKPISETSLKNKANFQKGRMCLSVYLKSDYVNNERIWRRKNKANLFVLSSAFCELRKEFEKTNPIAGFY
jgi:hypothetical protein